MSEILSMVMIHYWYWEDNSLCRTRLTVAELAEVNIWFIERIEITR